MRRTAGVASHPSSVSFSYELGKTARNVISRSSSSDVPRLHVPHSLRSSRLVVSWGVSCHIVVVVVARGGCRVLRFCSLASRRGRGVIRLSCVVAVCLPSSCACRLVRFSSLRLVWRLVARSPMSCGLRRRGVLAIPGAASRLIASWSGEASASCFIPAGSGWAAVLVLPSRGERCLLASVSSGNRAMPFLLSAFLCLFPIILWLRGGDRLRAASPFGSSSPVACSWDRRSFPVPFIRFEADGTGDGTTGCLAIGAWSVVARRLMYIMNMIYAMYIKDTRIQGYENMMDIWGYVDCGWDDGDVMCYAER